MLTSDEELNIMDQYCITFHQLKSYCTGDKTVLITRQLVSSDLRHACGYCSSRLLSLRQICRRQAMFLWKFSQFFMLINLESVRVMFNALATRPIYASSILIIFTR